MRLIRATSSYLNGDRYVTPDDPPFETHEDRARRLVAEGLAEFVADVASIRPPSVVGADEPPAVVAAVDPAHASAERAVARNRAKQPQS